jgi:hypothetical protein
MEDEKKSFLAQVMAPFIEGAQHTASAIGGDLEDKGAFGTLWSGAKQVAAGAPHVYMPAVPTYRMASQELSGDALDLMKRLGIPTDSVRQSGSIPMMENMFNQAGGPVVEGINRLSNIGKTYLIGDETANQAIKAALQKIITRR